MENSKINAEVISVFPNKVRISVDKLEDFKIAEEELKVGSYLRIADNDNAVLIAIIENFSIEVTNTGERRYFLEANPLGLIQGNKFERGGDTIAIPPKSVEPARKEEISKIYEESLSDNEKFTFSKLSANKEINVPVNGNGNKFFNKHIAIIGSTGSGKSHTVAKIIQNATQTKESEYLGLNNSHIVIFDIHSEYKTAFPDANFIDITNLTLPYWLLNSDELQELFLDTEANDHNQRNIFKKEVIESRKNHFKGGTISKEKIHIDSPLFFDIADVLQKAITKNEEIVDTGEVYASGDKKGLPKTTNGSFRYDKNNHIKRCIR